MPGIFTRDVRAVTAHRTPAEERAAEGDRAAAPTRSTACSVRACHRTYVGAQFEVIRVSRVSVRDLSEGVLGPAVGRIRSSRHVIHDRLVLFQNGCSRDLRISCHDSQRRYDCPRPGDPTAGFWLGLFLIAG